MFFFPFDFRILRAQGDHATWVETDAQSRLVILLF